MKIALLTEYVGQSACKIARQLVGVIMRIGASHPVGCTRRDNTHVPVLTSVRNQTTRCTATTNETHRGASGKLTLAALDDFIGGVLSALHKEGSSNARETSECLTPFGLRTARDFVHNTRDVCVCRQSGHMLL